ncbi:unnamed protein product, partial [Polarella glacialis]
SVYSTMGKTGFDGQSLQRSSSTSRLPSVSRSLSHLSSGRTSQDSAFEVVYVGGAERWRWQEVPAEAAHGHTASGFSTGSRSRLEELPKPKPRQAPDPREELLRKTVKQFGYCPGLPQKRVRNGGSRLGDFLPLSWRAGTFLDFRPELPPVERVIPSSVKVHTLKDIRILEMPPDSGRLVVQRWKKGWMAQEKRHYEPDGSRERVGKSASTGVLKSRAAKEDSAPGLQILATVKAPSADATQAQPAEGESKVEEPEPADGEPEVEAGEPEAAAGAGEPAAPAEFGQAGNSEQVAEGREEVIEESRPPEEVEEPDAADPEAAAVADPEAAAVAEPEVAAVAEPEVAAVAEPEVAAVAEPEAAAFAEPEAAAEEIAAVEEPED